MSDSKEELLIGRLAIHYKLLEKQQVHEAWTRKQKLGSDLKLGPFLVTEGLLTAEQLSQLERSRAQYLARRPGGNLVTGETSVPALAASPSNAPPQSGSLVANSEATETLASLAPGAQKPPSPSTQPAVPPAAPGGIGSPPAASPVSSSAVSLTPPSASSMAAALAAAPAASEAAEATPFTLAPPKVVAPITPPEPRDPLAEVRYSPDKALADLLRAAHLTEASDLHVHSGAPLKLRLHGELRDVESRSLKPEEAERLISGLLDAEQLQQLEERQQIDFSYEISGVGRFRANAYRQQKGLDAVFRTIPPEAPSLEQLGLPDLLGSFTDYHQGLVLVTGPAGCGKSTTMAAMIDRINRKRPDHIITIEDPIEVVHQSKRCVVNQRQVGPHTESFARALRAALREDPDVIVIGELRDLETISLALTAAETGHLVLGTLHTSSAIRTVNRLLGVFPHEQQGQIRTMLSESLRVVISQRLLPRAEGAGRVAALEVLVNSSAVGNLIRENKTFQLQSVMQVGAKQGMCLLDSYLQRLVKEGAITAEVARREAEEPKKIR